MQLRGSLVVTPGAQHHHHVEQRGEIREGRFSVAPVDVDTLEMRELAKPRDRRGSEVASLVEHHRAERPLHGARRGRRLGLDALLYSRSSPRGWFRESSAVPLSQNRTKARAEL